MQNQENMFTEVQIKELLSQVRTGADFPALALNLKNIGVIHYETSIRDGSSIFYGENDFELHTGPNYAPIEIADDVDIHQLKTDIAHHQQGLSDYFQISRQSAENGIEKWSVDLVAMTCTYLDKFGHTVWEEQIPVISNEPVLFTTEQLIAAHGKVKSGADFPSYIKEIKKLGVTHYETYVTDGHIDYHGGDRHTAKVPAKYAPLLIADTTQYETFTSALLAHQQGKTDFLTFITMCANTGIEKWKISMEKMTCTYYNKAGDIVLVEPIPQ